MNGTNMDQAAPNQPLIRYIVDTTHAYTEKYRLPRLGQGFLLWYAVEALGLSEDDAYVAVQVDGGNDKGIDFFFIDHENESILIAQGKFHDKGNYNARAGSLFELIHATDALHPEAMDRDGRPDLASAALDYQEAIERGYTVAYHYVYMGPAKQDVIDAARLFNADFDNSPGRTAHVIDMLQLERTHDEHIDASARILEATINVESRSAFEQLGSYGKSLVATVSGLELRRLYEEHGQSLFDRNVRLYLGARKGSVNFGIRETLNSSNERANFWAYNNGITFVCDQFEYDASNQVATIHRFSIVNGCQTTVSIASSDPTSLENVSVLARFIAAADPRTVDQVIKFNNSQTKIRDWDLASQDKAQKGLKSRLAEDPHPFFYQLRRGEWSLLASEDRQKFTRANKPQVIEPDILAQRIAAFKGYPVPAYKDKASLFTTLGKTVFPQEMKVEEVLMAWQAGEAAETIVSEAIVNARQSEEVLRARILSQGGKFFVLGIMASLLNERNGTQYLARLKREVAGSRNTREKLEIYAKMAMSYYLEIMEDRIEAGNVLNQMVRSEDSYDRVRSRAKSKWERESLSQGFRDTLPKFI